MSKQACDLLVSNGSVITMDGGGRIIEDGAIAVSDGQILSTGLSRRLSEAFEPAEALDAKGMIVMPGLVNTHTHAAMALLRGVADDMELKEWLEAHIWPLERKHMTRESARLGAELAICEMIRSGTTTFNDMYIFAAETADAAARAGMRAVAGEVLFDFPTPCVESPEEGLRHTERLMLKWKGHALVSISAAPHSIYSCSPSLLSECRALADSHGAQVHIHLSETKSEVMESRKRHGRSPVAHVEGLGLLKGKTLAAHCVHLDGSDIRSLARSGAGISHNPESNMKLASGVAPVPELLAAGARLGLGTDGAASNNDLDVFGEMSSCARLHKAFTGNPSVLDARTVVRMATAGGAAALGMADAIGSLEPGKRADMIMVDRSGPHATPLYSYYSHLVYCMSGHDVDTVIVEGRPVMSGRRLLTLDEERVLCEARSFAGRMTGR
jgi:5-methylthioadenosine/S-adenosylhomocysteine deaminase